MLIISSKKAMELIASILKALKGILKKPWLLLPALLLPLVMFGLLFILQEPLSNLLVETLFLENIPESPLAAFPVHLFAMYPIELAAVALLVLVSSILWIGLAFFYARVANDLEAGEASLAKALNATLAGKGNIVVLGIFFFIVALFFAMVAWIFLTLATLNALLGLALVALLGLLLFYLFVKLAFAVPAMAIDGAKAKEALAKSWAFTNSRFWSALVFLLVVAVTYSIIIGAGDWLDTIIPDELAGAVVFTIFWILGVSYSNMAIAFYYLKNTLGK